MMAGRRLSEGLHQAIEAKEQVEIQPENVTLASVTFQNFFRLYDKLSGMTGTAITEAEEFARSMVCVVECPPPPTPDRRGRSGVPHHRGKVQGDHRGDRQGP